MPWGKVNSLDKHYLTVEAITEMCPNSLTCLTWDCQLSYHIKRTRHQAVHGYSQMACLHDEFRVTTLCRTNASFCSQSSAIGGDTWWLGTKGWKVTKILLILTPFRRQPPPPLYKSAMCKNTTNKRKQERQKVCKGLDWWKEILWCKCFYNHGDLLWIGG